MITSVHSAFPSRMHFIRTLFNPDSNFDVENRDSNPNQPTVRDYQIKCLGFVPASNLGKYFQHLSQFLKHCFLK
jgi:hypothetical protein